MKKLKFECTSVRESHSCQSNVPNAIWLFNTLLYKLKDWSFQPCFCFPLDFCLSALQLLCTNEKTFICTDHWEYWHNAKVSVGLMPSVVLLLQLSSSESNVSGSSYEETSFCHNNLRLFIAVLARNEQPPSATTATGCITIYSRINHLTWTDYMLMFLRPFQTNLSFNKSFKKSLSSEMYIKPNIKLFSYLKFNFNTLYLNIREESTYDLTLFTCIVFFFKYLKYFTQTQNKQDVFCNKCQHVSQHFTSTYMHATLITQHEELISWFWPQQDEVKSKYFDHDDCLSQLDDYKFTSSFRVKKELSIIQDVCPSVHEWDNVTWLLQGQNKWETTSYCKFLTPASLSALCWSYMGNVAQT